MNNNEMLVSIGISFYNCERYLDQAILSVLNQTYSNWGLILIDDGSTDCSLEIAKSFNDCRIKIISDGNNFGLSYRLNQLIDLSEGKYFARMDADDIMYYDRLKIQVEYLENNPNVDVLGSYAYTIDNNNLIYGTMKVDKNPNSIEDVFKHRCFIHPTVLAKTEWCKANKYNLKAVRMEDAELWSRTILKSMFFNIDQPLLFYRQAGLPYLNRYLETQNGVRQLIKKYYDGLLRNKLLIRNYFKCLVFSILSILRLQNIFLKSRFKNMSKVDLMHGQKLLDKSIRSL